MARSLLSKIVLFGGIGGATSATAYYADEIKTTGIGGLRFGRATRTVVNITLDYYKTLYSGNIAENTKEYVIEKSKVHLRSAEKLLELCCLNGGVFIKVGQHLGSLEFLLPSEYVNTLKILHSKAPKSTLKSVFGVLKAELKCEPSELFDFFEPEPLGAASLAQVHRAILKDGREVAVKVQHPEVLDHSIIDLKGMEVLVRVVSRLFPDFCFDWLVDETKRNLPIELNFLCEGQNAERISNMFSHVSWLKVPTIDWNLSTKRVLTMEYCTGGQVNDLEYINSQGIDAFDVTDKLGQLYAEMIFVNGFVHCDPHPGNILVSKVGSKTEVTLLDHGLYLTLPENFRLTYGKLWQSILKADLPKIEEYSKELGTGELFGLFACMVTGRSWKSISKGIDKEKFTSEELDGIKQDAGRYIAQISNILDRVPRPMVLIFKTNECLRGIEFSLKTNERMNSFVSMSRSCTKAVFNEQRKACSSKFCLFKANCSESLALWQLSLYNFYLWIKSFALVRYIQRNIS